jgi:hypothetical protein
LLGMEKVGIDLKFRQYKRVSLRCCLQSDYKELSNARIRKGWYVLCGCHPVFVWISDFWKANAWYLVRFQFDETRYDLTRPVRRISFLDIADRKNREYLKIYIKYQLGVTGISVQNIWARTYITKAFLRFLDQEKLAVDQLTAAEIDLYMRKLREENVEIATFNDKVAEIHNFFRFLTVRGYYSKVPFYPEYYIKRDHCSIITGLCRKIR